MALPDNKIFFTEKKKKQCQTIRRPERNFTSILLMKETFKKIIDTVKYPWLGQGLELGLGIG